MPQPAPGDAVCSQLRLRQDLHTSLVDFLVVATAQYLPFLIPVVAAVVWWFLPRPDKVTLALNAVLALGLAYLLITVAGAVFQDPRPFAVDPTLAPLFPHAPDNGFPSDHTTLGATVALLVLPYRRRLGAVLLVASLVAGMARVAAHVHHVQDIVAGLALAALAVALTTAIWRWASPRIPALRARSAVLPRLSHMR